MTAKAAKAIKWQQNPHMSNIQTDCMSNKILGIYQKWQD